MDAQDPNAVAACFTSAYTNSPVYAGSYLRQHGRIWAFSPHEILRLLGFPGNVYSTRHTHQTPTVQTGRKQPSLRPVCHLLSAIFPRLTDLQPRLARASTTRTTRLIPAIWTGYSSLLNSGLIHAPSSAYRFPFAGSIGCRKIDPAPEDFDALLHYFWQKANEGSDAEIAEGVRNLHEAIGGDTLDGPQDGTLSRLTDEETAFIDLDATPDTAAGIYLLNPYQCSFDDLTTIVTHLDQQLLYPGVYDSYERDYLTSREAFLDGQTNRLEWDLHYGATLLGSSYTATVKINDAGAFPISEMRLAKSVTFCFGKLISKSLLTLETARSLSHKTTRSTYITQSMVESSTPMVSGERPTTVPASAPRARQYNGSHSTT